MAQMRNVRTVHGGRLTILYVEPSRKSDDVSSRVDMAALLLEMGFDIDPTAEEQVTYCLFHQDSNTKSFSVNLSKRVFHCFSPACGVRGSAVMLYALWKQIPYAQAVQEILYLPKHRDLARLQTQLAATAPLPSVMDRLSGLTEFVEAMPLLADHPLAKVLTDRGISIEAIRKHGFRAYDPQIEVKFDAEKMVRAGVFNVWRRGIFLMHQILFPFYVGDHVIFVQGRQASDDPTRPKYLGARGTISAMWNHSVLRTTPKEVYLTEGVIDALSLHELGFGPALGIVGADGFKADWVDDFKGILKVVIATDHDPAGDAAFEVIRLQLSRVVPTVERFQFPAEHKDINDFLRKR